MGGRESRASGADLGHGFGGGEQRAGGVDEDGLMRDVAVDGPPVVVVLPRPHELPPRGPWPRGRGHLRRRPERPPLSAGERRRQPGGGRRAQPRHRHCLRGGEMRRRRRRRKSVAVPSPPRVVGVGCGGPRGELVVAVYRRRRRGEW